MTETEVERMGSERHTTGVNAIWNRSNGKVYVGSATRSLLSRWKEHRNALIAGRHFNKHLQTAWNKYGGGVFDFVVLEEAAPEKCLEVEQHWIDWLMSYDRDIGYNSRPKAESNLGMVFGPQSEETKAKKSASLKDHWLLHPRKHTDEAKAKISVAGKGVKRSEEFKANVSKSRTGHEVTPETRAKLSAAHTGKTMSEESRAKMSASKLGKKHKKKRSGVVFSPEHRANLSRRVKESWIMRRFKKLTEEV